jgi:hypothetical protein
MRATSIVSASLFVAACGGGGGAPSAPSADGASALITDAEVSALVRAPTGWTYYKLRSDTLVRAAGSAHGDPRLRTRYNAIAATQLDASGRVRAGAVFPDSALIVKELINGSTLSRYAVMMKLRGSSNAGGGWLWAYYAPNGATQVGIGGKGSGCVGCHGSGIDFTRMNDSHP